MQLLLTRQFSLLQTKMISFENIKEFATGFPVQWSFLGEPEEANALSQEHKDQVFFLNKEATKFLYQYITSSKMISGPIWKPFNEQYFKTIEEFKVGIDCKDELKKWLYNRGIPFRQFVFIDEDFCGQAVMLTWKMLIKYWDGLFLHNDLIIFDQTLNWGLFYFHHDVLYFGKDKIYDKEIEYQKTKEANELRQKYFPK